jgi:3-deoxy-D-manno-octulosonic-acid transferase
LSQPPHPRADTSRAAGGRLALTGYALLTGAAGLGAGVVRGWARSRGKDGLAADLGQRLARDPGLEELPRGAMWLHAASVGEVRATAPLARALRQRRPGLELVVTTATRTGRRCAEQELGAPARLAPWDAAGPLRRFLRALRPRLHVSVETEIWPLRLRRLQRAGVPCALVSARISAGRAPRYRRAGALFRPALRGLALVAPSSVADRDRLLALGARLEALGPEGSLKWDACPEPPGEAATEELRSELGLERSRAWVVLGSVHPGESGPLLAELLSRTGDEMDWGALVAPRHPARFEDVATELAGLPVPVHRASTGPAPADARVVLIDTLGVLPRLYPLARAAFVGGTLVPVGGHSPLEAAAAAVPISIGPHHAQQGDLLAPLEQAGAARVGEGAAAAASALARWIRDPDEAAAAGARARAEVDRRRGLSEPLAESLLELLS